MLISASYFWNIMFLGLHNTDTAIVCQWMLNKPYNKAWRYQIRSSRKKYTLKPKTFHRTVPYYILYIIFKININMTKRVKSGTWRRKSAKTEMVVLDVNFLWAMITWRPGFISVSCKAGYLSLVFMDGLWFLHGREYVFLDCLL